MSRASMSFTFEDGTVLHGIYNGTVDLAFSFIVKTKHEAWTHFREGYPTEKRLLYDDSILDPECNCGVDPESVQVKSEYGGGRIWKGTACRKCMVFIGPCDPYEREPPDGHSW